LNYEQIIIHICPPLVHSSAHPLSTHYQSGTSLLSHSEYDNSEVTTEVFCGDDWYHTKYTLKQPSFVCNFFAQLL